MRIEPTLPPPASVTQTLGPNALLPVGRVLSAVVIAQRTGELYELISGNLRLLAESKQPLKSGDPLMLRVTGRDAQQRPTLEIVTPEITRAQTAPWLREALPRQQDATRLLATLWQLAGAATTPSAGQNPALQNPALQSAAQILQQLPSRQQLTEPQGLQRALHHSGLFLEAQLARPGAAPEADLKALLMQLMRALGGKPRPETPRGETPPRNTEAPAQRPAADTYSPRQMAAQRLAESTTPLARQAGPAPGPSATATTTPSNPAAATEARFHLPHPEQSLPGQVRPTPRAEPLPTPMDTDSGNKLVDRLAREVDNALARVESHQLLHIDRKEAHHAQWLMELPVRDKDGVDLWQVHVTRDDRESTGEPNDRERRWHIVLSFDFPGTGPVLVKVEHSQERLFVAFHAASARTDALIAESSESLKSTLKEQGIPHVQIAHRQGLPAPETLPQSLHRVLEDQA